MPTLRKSVKRESLLYPGIFSVSLTLCSCLSSPPSFDEVYDIVQILDSPVPVQCNHAPPL